MRNHKGYYDLKTTKEKRLESIKYEKRRKREKEDSTLDKSFFNKRNECHKMILSTNLKFEIQQQQTQLNSLISG